MANRTCLIEDALAMPRAGVPTASRGYNRTRANLPLSNRRTELKSRCPGGPHGAVTLISEVRGTIEEQSWWSDT